MNKTNKKNEDTTTKPNSEKKEITPNTIESKEESEKSNVTEIPFDENKETVEEIKKDKKNAQIDDTELIQTMMEKKETETEIEPEIEPKEIVMESKPFPKAPEKKTSDVNSPQPEKSILPSITKNQVVKKTNGKPLFESKKPIQTKPLIKKQSKPVKDIRVDAQVPAEEVESNTADELEQLKQEILNSQAKANPEKVQAPQQDSKKFQREDECKIVVKLKSGAYKVNPYKDKIFALICQGYDNISRQPCYRYIKDLTFNQTEKFREFIHEYGCICGDKQNQQITVNPVLDQLFQDIPITPKVYEKKFIMFYLKRFRFDTVQGAFNVDEKGQEIQEGEDQGEGEETTEETTEEDQGLSDEEMQKLIDEEDPNK